MVNFKLILRYDGGDILDVESDIYFEEFEVEYISMRKEVIMEYLNEFIKFLEDWEE